MTGVQLFREERRNNVLRFSCHRSLFKDEIRNQISGMIGSAVQVPEREMSVANRADTGMLRSIWR